MSDVGYDNVYKMYISHINVPKIIYRYYYTVFVNFRVPICFTVKTYFYPQVYVVSVA